MHTDVLPLARARRNCPGRRLTSRNSAHMAALSTATGKGPRACPDFKRELIVVTETLHLVLLVTRAGIGKTTLAEMLLLEYAAAGYQPVVVSADVAKANKVWSSDPGVPPIFYYDDFLGHMLDARDSSAPTTTRVTASIPTQTAGMAAAPRR